MTTQEILKDLEILRYGDNTEKKEIRSKYGIESNKKGEIEKILWSLAVETIKTKISDFNYDDLRIFSHNYSTSTKKAALEAVKHFTPEFISYLIVCKKNNYKAHLRSVSEKSYFREYVNLEEALYEIQHKEVIEKTKADAQLILNRLVDITTNYKKMVRENLLNSAKARFEHYKNLNYSELTNRIKKMYNEISIHSDKFTNIEKYLNYIDDNFERTFDSNLKAIVQRLLPYGITENINLKYIAEDPKFIEMVLETPEGNWHCRSILAAENSFYISTHWRFIITLKNK